MSWDKIQGEIDKKFSSVKNISTQDLKQIMDQKANITLIDVRDPKEFSVSRIPHAINITDPQQIANDYPDFQQTIILYCSVGYRSAQAAEQLQKAGWNNIYNLKGSIFEWADKGYPLVNDDGETPFVHPYDDYWGMLLNSERHSSF